jgi:formylglycine-generating enzyme required for sulfatase activity
VAADDARADPLLAGVPEVEGFKVLGGVVICDKIGQGGMGAVYRGRHLRLNVDVALKIMAPPSNLSDEAHAPYVQRFLREAQTAAQVDHPNLVRVYDVDSNHGLHYLIMQLIDGESAGERLARKTSLAEAEAVAICLGAAEGLAEAHRRGIVHRDVKPDNLMIAPDGRVRVLDLGLAKAVTPDAAGGVQMLTRADSAMGTPSFMSPEQFVAARDVTPASDVWSLGVTLFHLLSGVLPWAGSSVYVLARMIQEEAPPNLKDMRAGVSDGACAIVTRALEKSPSARLADCGQMAAALREHLTSLGVTDPMCVLADPEAASARARRVVAVPGPEKLTNIARAVSRIGGAASAQGPPAALTVAYPPRAPSPPSSQQTLPTARITAPEAPAGLAQARSVAAPDVDPGASHGRLVLAMVVVLIGVAAAGFGALRWALSTGAAVQPPDDAAVAVAAAAGPVQTIDLGRGVTLAMVPIRPGRFTRGSPATESGRRADESPALAIRISRGFLMSATEVTQAQYERVTGRNPSNARSPDRPVEQVSWTDAGEFCKALSRVARRRFRLPTEAEWEYACRAGGTTAFSWGDAATPEFANYDAAAPSPLSRVGAARGQTLPVGRLPANAWGLFDMHGNVAEWCADWYDAGSYASGPDTDPPGPPVGEHRAYRGGSWFHDATSMRAARRAGTWPTNSNSSIGFRVVAELP